MESIRKDVECTSGILKKHFAILKNKFWLHHVEDISRIFKACSILHNLLHDWDGYNNWEEVEEAYNRLQEADVDMSTMRDHRWAGFYRDSAPQEDAEEENEFNARRASLIEHYIYCRTHRVR